MRWRRTSGRAGVVLLLLLTAWAAAGSGPEERRFDSADFYEGLKQRGLTELLKFYLREHPPADDADALRIARDLKLAEHAAPSRSPAERAAALAEANRILETLIER